MGGTHSSTPPVPQDPGFRPLCLSAREIKHRVTDMRRLAWAHKMRHVCNPVLAFKKSREPQGADKKQPAQARRDLCNAFATGQRERESLCRSQEVLWGAGKGLALSNPKEKVKVTLDCEPSRWHRKRGRDLCTGAQEPCLRSSTRVATTRVCVDRTVVRSTMNIRGDCMEVGWAPSPEKPIRTRVVPHPPPANSQVTSPPGLASLLQPTASFHSPARSGDPTPHSSPCARHLYLLRVPVCIRGHWRHGTARSLGCGGRRESYPPPFQYSGTHGPLCGGTRRCLGTAGLRTKASWRGFIPAP